MRKEEKVKIVEELKEKLVQYNHFYLTDISTLNALDTGKLRRKCFASDIKLMVVKNTLLKKALETSEGKFESLYDVLKDSTSIMFSDTGNSPAKVIKDFRKTSKRPVLKAAFVEESIYIGDENVETLAMLKSKEELIGDIIALLQSPAKNVLSALQSKE